MTEASTCPAAVRADEWHLTVEFPLVAVALGQNKFLTQGHTLFLDVAFVQRLDKMKI